MMESYPKLIAENRKKIRNLKSKLNHATDKAQRSELLAGLVGSFLLNQPQKAFLFAQELFDLSIQENNPLFKGVAYNAFAMAKLETGQLKEAHAFALNALEILPLNHESRVLSYQILAEILTNRGEYEQALTFLYQSLEFQNSLQLERYKPFTNGQLAKILYRKGRYQEALDICLNTLKTLDPTLNPLQGAEAFHHHVIGLIYAQQREFKNAIEHYNLSMKIWKLLENTFQIIGIYVNIGSIYLIQEDVRLAERYYTEALDLDAANGGNTKMQSLIYQNLAIIHRRLGKADFARTYYDKALDLCKSNQDKYGEMHVLYNLGVLYYASPEQAIPFYEQTLKIAESIEDKQFKMHSCKNLSELHASLKHYEPAYRFLLQAQQIEQDLFGVERTKALLEFENLHRSEEQVRELENLRRHNEKLQSFAQRAIHEIKEPLRMISSFGNRLQQRSTEKLDEREQEYLQYMTSAAAYVNELVEDILTYSLIGESQKNNQLADLNDVLYTSLSNLKQSIENNHVNIVAHELLTVQAPTMPLIQVFQHLLENAIKFRAEIPLTIEILNEPQPESGLVKITVRDNGIGIEPKNHKRVFKAFEKLQPKMSQSGSGFGLAICKRIVELLGGKIWIESDGIQGTAVHFTVPMAKL